MDKRIAWHNMNKTTSASHYTQDHKSASAHKNANSSTSQHREVDNKSDLSKHNAIAKDLPTNDNKSTKDLK